MHIHELYCMRSSWRYIREVIIEYDCERLIKQISGESIVDDWRLDNITTRIRRKVNNIAEIE